MHGLCLCYQIGRGEFILMSKVLSAAIWSFELLAKRIAFLRVQKVFLASRIYGESVYDEAQMRESDSLNRMQRAELEYDC